MAVVTITIPEGQFQRVLDSYASAYHRDTDSVETKTAFLERMLAEHLWNAVGDKEFPVVRSAAIAARSTKIRNEIQISGKVT